MTHCMLFSSREAEAPKDSSLARSITEDKEATPEPFQGFPTYVSHPAVVKGIFTREDEDYWDRDEF